MRPSDSLALRRIAYEQCNVFLDHYEQDDAPSTGIDQAIVESAYDYLRSAECAYVTTEMTSIADSTMKSMPDDVVLEATDPYFDNGFLVWDAPITVYDRDKRETTVHTASVVWKINDLTGMPYWLYDDDGSFIRGPVGAQADDPDSPPTGVYDGDLEVEVVVFFGEYPHTSYMIPAFSFTWMIGETAAQVASGCKLNIHRDVIDAIVGRLYTTWALMRQSITTVERTPAQRHERKRSAKAVLPSKLVVVRLRKRSLGDDMPDEPGRDVEWSHRWLVRAHWKRQWFPSLGKHKKIIIFPYVKGPEDKPLVVKERVTAWVR